MPFEKPTTNDGEANTSKKSNGAKRDGDGSNPAQGLTASDTKLEFFGEEYQPQRFAQRVEELIQESMEMAGKAEETPEITSLADKVDDVENRLDDIELVIEVLAAESDVLEGECPQCGGKMETTGLLASKRVECGTCGRYIAPSMV